MRTNTVIDGRDFYYEVWIDGRVYKFLNGLDAMDFAKVASRHITKKSWESEIPEIGVKIVTTQEEPEEPEVVEDLEEPWKGPRCDEQLEKECEA